MVKTNSRSMFDAGWNTDGVRQNLTFLFILVFCTVIFLATYILKRQVWPGHIIYYEGIEMIFVSLVPALAILCLVYHRTQKTSWSMGSMGRFLFAGAVFPAVVAFIAGGWLFVTTIPALLDRSISIYVISYVAESETQGATYDELNRGFREIYDGNHAVEKRLDEQMQSGDVVERDARYYITPRGLFVYKTNVFLAGLLHIDKRLVQARRYSGR